LGPKAEGPFVQMCTSRTSRSRRSTRTRRRSARRGVPWLPSAWRLWFPLRDRESFRASSTDQQSGFWTYTCLPRSWRRQLRVHVVGRGDQDGVNVLLALEHLAIVGIASGFQEVDGLERTICQRAPALHGIERHLRLARGGGAGSSMRFFNARCRGRAAESLSA